MKIRRIMGRKGKKKPMEFKHILPNMVTSGNLLCGLFSLILVLHGRYVPAAWLVFFAVIFDGFDGKVARMLGGGSQFGMEFDSLADLVSFGVAPAILLYEVSMRGLHFAGAVVSCFFALCVALRLARFNVVHVPCGRIVRFVIRDCWSESSCGCYGYGDGIDGLPHDFEHTIREHEEADEEDGRRSEVPCAFLDDGAFVRIHEEGSAYVLVCDVYCERADTF